MRINKLGIVRVSYDLIDTEPDMVSEVFNKLGAVVLRCELIYPENCFSYTMYSPLFEPVSKGTLIPEYQITINYSEGAIQSVEVKMIADQANIHKSVLVFGREYENRNVGA